MSAKDSGRIGGLLQQLAQVVTGKQLTDKQRSDDRKDFREIDYRIVCFIRNNNNAIAEFREKAQVLDACNFKTISITSMPLHRCNRLVEDYMELSDSLDEMREPIKQEQFFDALQMLELDLVPLVRKISSRQAEETGRPGSSSSDLIDLIESVERLRDKLSTTSKLAWCSVNTPANGKALATEREGTTRTPVRTKVKYAFLGVACGVFGCSWSGLAHRRVLESNSGSVVRTNAAPSSASSIKSSAASVSIKSQSSSTSL